MRVEPVNSLALRAPGRLHLGFLDPSGSLGRRFGSLGLVVDGFETEIELSTALIDNISADTTEARAQLERARACMAALRERTGLREALHLRLLRVLPAHAGFGSGTQLALAIGRAFVRWHRLEVGTTTLAHWLGRGQRSGIGIHGFDEGGLLVDGGPARDGRPAPLLARVALPGEWRVVVIEDARLRGLAGDAEATALGALPPMPAARAAEICHEVLMRVLPGAAEGDFEPFARGVSRVQQLLGEHYAPAQDGRPYTSPAVGQVLDWIGATGRGAAIGQSSWGPTGFAILPSQALAEALVDDAEAAGCIERGLSMRIVPVRNRGAEITDTRAAVPPVR